jgi:hypothetical protein
VPGVIGAAGRRLQRCRRKRPQLACLLLLAGCATQPAAFPEDVDFACADGRQLRLLVEDDWDRAVLSTNSGSVTLLRAEAADGERWVARTGWELRVDGDEAVLTSPGRPRTSCAAGATG